MMNTNCLSISPIFQRLLLVLLLGMGGLQVSAQERISLKQAINYALTYKADAVKAKLEVKNADYQIAEARSGALPKLNVDGSLTYNPILQETALPGDFLDAPGEIIMVPFGQKWGSNVGVQVEQALFNQQVFVGLKAARTTKEFYQVNQKLTDEQLIEKVATAYYEVLSTKSQLKTIDSSYANIEKVKGVISGLYDSGLAKKIDLDRTNVRLTNTKTSQIQLQKALEQKENALKFYIGMPINRPILLEASDLDVKAPPLPAEIDVNDRTEIELMDKQKQLLEYQVDASKAALYPSLSLIGNYAWQATGDAFPIGKGKSDMVYWTDYAAIGLQLHIPIFNGMQTKSKINQNKIELESLKADLKDSKLGMQMDYENAKAQIQSALSAIGNQEANLELAQSVFSDTQNNYQNGLASLTDLLESETELVQARNNYTDAILDFKMAEIQLYKSQGELEELIK